MMPCVWDNWASHSLKIAEEVIEETLEELAPLARRSSLGMPHTLKVFERRRGAIAKHCMNCLFRMAMVAHIALGFSSKQTDRWEGLGPYHLGPAEIEQEIWLKDAVLGLFPDTRDCSPKLANFFVGEKRIFRGTRQTKETPRSPTLNHRPSAVLPPECASSDERVPHLSSPRHFGTAVKQLAPSSFQSPLKIKPSVRQCPPTWRNWNHETWDSERSGEQRRQWKQNDGEIKEKKKRRELKLQLLRRVPAVMER
ncbi:hypothetical protein Sjap_018083 [Stephania japonica]|uniref:Uncharacterized protein n=1 Tax=Stephania japonica TaxID=461633 RepID=A0AAP0I7C0_9MAGN